MKEENLNYEYDGLRQSEPSNDVEEFNPETFGNNALAQVMDTCDVINKGVTTVADTVKYIANVNYEISKLDHQLEAFIAQTRSNLERFKTAMPVLERQLNNISGRIDRITDNIIMNTQAATLTEDAVKKHQLLIELLTNTNDSFNNMLVKMLAL